MQYAGLIPSQGIITTAVKEFFAKYLAKEVSISFSLDEVKGFAEDNLGIAITDEDAVKILAKIRQRLSASTKAWSFKLLQITMPKKRTSICKDCKDVGMFLKDGAIESCRKCSKLNAPQSLENSFEIFRQVMLAYEGFYDDLYDDPDFDEKCLKLFEAMIKQKREMKDGQQ